MTAVVLPFLLAPVVKPFRRRLRTPRLRRPHAVAAPVCTMATSRWFTCGRTLPCTSHDAR